MAEFLSRQKTALTGSPKIKNEPNFEGDMRVKLAVTPVTAAWAQNDSFATGIIVPKGATILPLSQAVTTNWGASVTMDVGLRGVATGTVLSSTAIANAVAMSSASLKALNNGGYTNSLTQLAEDAEVVCVMGGANPTDDSQMTIWITWLEAH